MTEVIEKLVVRSLRELDELVAKHVMNDLGKPRYYLSSDGGQSSIISFGWESEAIEWLNQNKHRQSIQGVEICKIISYPFYSRSVGCAWKVVEKTCPRTDESLDEWYQFLLEFDPPLYDAAFSKHEIYQVAPEDQRLLGKTDNRTVWRHKASNESPAIAICLAALKTKGIDVELELSDV